MDQSIGAKEVVAALKAYVQPLFSPRTSIGVIACGSAQAKALHDAFSSESKEFEISVLSWDKT